MGLGKVSELRNELLKASALKLMRTVANGYTSSPLPEWETFTRNVRLYSYEKGAVVDRPSHDIMIVLRGGLKLVYDDSHIQGQIAEFFFTGSVASNSPEPPWSTTKTSPFSVARYLGSSRRWTAMSLHALEPTTVACFDYRLVCRLASIYPQWGEAHAAFLWTYIEALFAKLNSMHTKDLPERYTALMQRHGIKGNVSQRDVAAYLGVTEAALSRIVKRVNERE